MHTEPKNIVHLCDCMEFMAGLPDKAYDLAIVDPPYGIGDFNNKQTSKKPYNKNFDIAWNEHPPDELYFSEIKRIAKNHIIFGFQFYIRYLWDDLKGIIIHDFGSTGGYGSDADLAITNLQNRVTYFKYRWQGFITDEPDYNRIHPCQKPIALYKWLLSHYAKPGQTIFDSHVGSGSIRIACHDLGFDFEGCEIDADYWTAQEARFKEYLKQPKLFTEPEPEYRQPDLIGGDDG